MHRRINISDSHHPIWHALFIAAIVAAAVMVLLWAANSAGAVDTIELLSGAKVSGTVTGKDSTSVTMNVTVGGITLKRVYQLSTVHVVTIGDKRYVINEKTGSSAPKSPATPSTSKTATKTTPPPASGGGSRAELDALIDRVGREQPDWYAATALNYPTTLDLQWPKQPSDKGWNNQKNVGQFIWDIINPNTNRWREGVRFMHHMLGVHKDNPAVLNRVMLELGRMYHDLLEDYARSAFWFRAAGVEKDPADFLRSSVTLAECYWRLGYRDEALKLLAKAPSSFAQVKLYADMGETQRAVRIAEAGAASSPEIAYLAAGDAYRVASDYQQALNYYQKLVNLDPKVASNAGRLNKYKARAQENVNTIRYFELFDLSKVPDGAYKSSSLGYEGQVEVTVSVRNQKLESVAVTQHREKQFYSAISDTPKKIIAKQSVKGVDTTSNATITSEAIINATAKAIGEAK